MYVNAVSNSQITQDWVKSYSSIQLNSQIAFDAVTDSAGNIYVTGSTSRGYDLPDMVTIKYTVRAVTNYELRITNYELQVTNIEFQKTIRNKTEYKAAAGFCLRFPLYCRIFTDYL